MTSKTVTNENNLVVQQIKRAAESLIKEKAFIKDLIRFYERIFLKQFETEHDIKKNYSDLKEKKTFPLIERKDFEIDFKASETLFKKICDICAENKINPDPAAKSIKASLNASDLSFESIVINYLENDAPIPQYTKASPGFNPHLYDFILYNSVKPSIVKCSNIISKNIKKTTALENGRCPICKSAPAISIISKKTGSRSLVCSFCWHEYKTRKSTCPFCKNEDANTLAYISLDTEKGIKADYCERCKKYIKTINLKEYRKDIYLPFELIASIPFDMKMNKDGYQPE